MPDVRFDIASPASFIVPRRNDSHITRAHDVLSDFFNAMSLRGQFNHDLELLNIVIKILVLMNCQVTVISRGFVGVVLGVKSLMELILRERYPPRTRSREWSLLTRQWTV